MNTTGPLQPANITSTRQYGELDEYRFARNPHDIQLGGREHLTADDFCFYGRPSRKCGCGFCREMVARERDERSIV